MTSVLCACHAQSLAFFQLTTVIEFLLSCWHKQFNQFNHIKVNISLVFIQCRIINGYQFLCDAHTVLEPHSGTAAFFLFYSLLSFSTFSFYMFVQSYYFFLGATLVCVNNLKRTADLFF